MLIFGIGSSISHSSPYVSSGGGLPDPPVVTVAADGSGDFNCDGISDQVEINQAIDFVATHSDFTTVYLKGPGTYIIDEPIVMQSNVTLTGDPSTKVQLKDYAMWWTPNKPLITQKGAEWDPWGSDEDFICNVEIYGFELSGGVQMEPTGKNYIPLIHFMNPYNVSIHDMHLHDSRWDIIRLTSSSFSTSINSKVYDNLIETSGHEGICFVGVIDFEAYNNEIYTTRTNCGIRVKDCDNFSLYVNRIGNSLTRMPSGYAGIFVQNPHTPVSHAEIYDNFIYGKDGGIVLEADEGIYATGVHIHHNIIYKPRNRVSDTGIPLNGGIRINGFNNTIIEYNVIERSDKDGIVYEGSGGIGGRYQTIVRNNIIADSKGYGLNNLEREKHSFISEYNNIFNNAKGNYNNAFSTTDIHVDPSYARPSLKSGWHHVVGVYDGGTETIKIYVDGREKASKHYLGFGKVAINDHYAYFGGYRGVDYWMDGKLDEVAIWNRALSDAEISSLWNEGKGSFITIDLTCDLLAYWQMENNWNDSWGSYDGYENYSTATFTSDAKLGDYAGLFDHTYAIFPNNISPSPSVTVAAWVYRDESSMSQDVEQTIFNKGSQSQNNHIWLYCKEDNFYFEVGNGEYRICVSSPGIAVDELDFHLKSEQGRWNGFEWVYDNITSLCINSGDPESDYSKEPVPNGGRVNIGAYGNTIEASKGDDNPIADADGPYIGVIGEPLHFTASVYRGHPPYSYHWDFGDGKTSEEANPSHEYNAAGNYTITLTVVDRNGTVAVDTTWALILESNNPPDIPSIEGKTRGRYGEEYGYTFSSTDPEGQEIWYYIDWGDGQYEGWIGPYDSREKVTATHTWDKKGNYIIRVKAKDASGAESDWATLEVSMPKK